MLTDLLLHDEIKLSEGSYRVSAHVEHIVRINWFSWFCLVHLLNFNLDWCRPFKICKASYT